jgi:hypothetical protein
MQDVVNWNAPLAKMEGESISEMVAKGEPKVSIILLNLNNYRDTHDCLRSVQQLEYSNFDVITVDNGSSDGSCTLLQNEFPEFKFLRSEENVGFSAGNNLGIEEALRGASDYVLLLNNDTIVDPSFLSSLVQVAESDSRIGIVGPKIYYSSEPQRIWYAGGYMKYVTGNCHIRGLDQVDSQGKFCRVEETQFVSGCAMMIKSEVLRRVGLLDARLFAYWEDTDFCARARKAGYRSVFVPNALLWHKVSRTNGASSPFALFLTTRNHLTWVAKHVPFPYKPVALGLTFLRKLFKAARFAFRDRSSASAVWAGIVAFVFGVYGPTQRPRQPAASVSRAA